MYKVSYSRKTASDCPLSRYTHEYQKPDLQPHYHKGFLILQKRHFLFYYYILCITLLLFNTSILSVISRLVETFNF